MKLNLPRALAPLAFAAVFGSRLPDAGASVSFAVRFDELVARAASVDLVTALEKHSTWEDGRIYTYTRVHVDRAVAGALPVGAEAWIRTLGGVIDDVGQNVDGEPVFEESHQYLVFLQPAPGDTYAVTARAQGQFPISGTESAVARAGRLIRSYNVGVLLPPHRRRTIPASALATQSVAPTASPAPVLARDVLNDRSIDEAARDVAMAWSRAHAP